MTMKDLFNAHSQCIIAHYSTVRRVALHCVQHWRPRGEGASVGTSPLRKKKLGSMGGLLLLSSHVGRTFFLCRLIYIVFSICVFWACPLPLLKFLRAPMVYNDCLYTVHKCTLTVLWLYRPVDIRGYLSVHLINVIIHA